MKAALFSPIRYQGPSNGTGWPIPGTVYSAEAAEKSMRSSLAQFRLADEVGFDWVTVAEHHYSPFSLNPNPVGVVADAATADVALALIAARPELVRALALIAPPIPKSALADLKTPVLALFGTRAMSPQVGRQMREAIPNCHVMLVYDADGDMTNQRPEAVAAALRDFMLSGDRFLVTGKSGKLYP
jgi:hypothetical protein